MKGSEGVLPKGPARLPLYDRSLKVIHPNRSSPLKSAAILLTFFLTASLSQAAVVGSWTLDETSGDILDATGNHPEGMATGTPTYSTAGMPNGSSGTHDYSSLCRKPYPQPVRLIRYLLSGCRVQAVEVFGLERHALVLP